MISLDHAPEGGAQGLGGLRSQDLLKFLHLAIFIVGIFMMARVFCRSGRPVTRVSILVSLEHAESLLALLFLLNVNLRGSIFGLRSFCAARVLRVFDPEYFQGDGPKFS